jgi:hypothetical protein
MRIVFSLLLVVLVFQQAVSAQLPPVYLNHLYLVLDKQTYANIAKSDFMRNEFANFEERTTTANKGESWTGGYFYGEQTYIELFIAGQNPQFKQSESGIGFGVEQEGASEIFYNRLKEKFPDKVEKGLRTKKINDKDVAWFYIVDVDFKDESATFFPWLMEYRKDYLPIVYPNLKPEENGITRQRYQARRFKADRLFKDISEVTIALNETERDRFIKELEAFNYKIERRKAKTVCKGKDVKFFVVPNTKANGITKLKIGLQRKKKGQKIYQFGAKSVLRFKGKTATWTLR